ncbi:HD family phosphohydrolase [Tumebacillus flagellatus]|uniref:7TM receptor with intracellular metal dependent phosphohydrolase n=1 Tax=Tumebacillus flagellatus TaxID=1157490 RepID=A0A074LV27_9BACL|nr:HD family phosphohydrolase [Tumebacillus flagellatus]KEO83808.1 7TM receptor with intracellular metal dependent phosphohydrolase [Tumebacillus flagellatus]
MRSNLLKHIRQITLSPELRKSRALRVSIYIVLAALLYLLFLGNVLPERFNYEVGSIAGKTIKAPTDAIDTQATKKLRDEARKEVGPQFNRDIEVEDKAYQSINTFLDTVQKVATDPNIKEADKLAAFKNLHPPITVSDETLAKLLQQSPDTLASFKKEATRVTQKIYSDNITDDNLPSMGSKLDAQLAYADLDREGRLIVKEFVQPVIHPNMIYDQEATSKKREEAAQSKLPVQINKGEIIVKQGERIDEDTLYKLEDLKLLSKRPNYRMYFGFAGLIALWMLVLGSYIEMTRHKLSRNNLLLLCVSIIILVTGLGIKVITLFTPLGFPNLGYLTPIAMGTMLVTILFDMQLGIMLSFLFALLTGVAFDLAFQYVFASFISGLVGTFAVSRVKHRLVIMRAGFLIAGCNLITISAMQALTSSTGNELSPYLQSLLYGIINGVFSAIITIGLLPFLESTFGILTPISLLELSNPNHPLLKKLLMEAPGTYHHSLIVGNLAEAAAEMVGADPLICRVGAYFHDVGKMKRPLFFIENQLSKDNPHDKIAPTLSHLIITSHVRDGLEMQEEARLPKPIRDICEQHHGTTILWYFYNKALEQDKSGSIQPDDFRYPGPKPQSKEAAIVMLCDAVEAAVRAMNRPTPNRIESVIHKIVKDRLNDGQLDECDLTLKDLDKVSDAFLRTLNGIYHARIEYPELPKSN